MCNNNEEALLSNKFRCVLLKTFIYLFVSFEFLTFERPHFTTPQQQQKGFPHNSLACRKSLKECSDVPEF